MTNKMLQKRSADLINSEPKLPSSTDLEYGELAVNYTKGPRIIQVNLFKKSVKKLKNFIKKKVLEFLHFITNESNVKPSSSDIEYGEIAINYKKNEERLFIKNDSDEIIEFRDKKYIDTINSKKQDVIEDLDNIRNNANLGATALQTIPDEYLTENEMKDFIINGGEY